MGLHMHRQLVAAGGIAAGHADELTGKGGVLFQDRRHRLREHIDAADLDHVVTAAEEALDPAQVHAQRGRGGQHAGHVMGVEADDRVDVVLVQAGHHHVADFAIGHDLAIVDAEDFHVLGIFHQVQAILVRALAGNRTGVTDAVPVIQLHPAPGRRQRLARFTAQVATDHPHRDVLARFQALLAGHVGQLLDVVGKTNDDVGAHVLHQLHLLRRAHLDAGAGRAEQGLGVMGDRLAHIVAAVDHAVAVDRVDHVARLHPLPAVQARQQQRLHLARVRRKHQRLRPAGGAGSGMEHQRLVAGLGTVLPAVEIAQRRIRFDRGHDLVLAEHRQLGDVIQAADVFRLDPGIAPQALVERDLPGTRDAAQELLVLLGAQLLAADGLELVGEGLVQRKLLQQFLDIKRFEIGGVAHGASTISRSTSWRTSAMSSR